VTRRGSRKCQSRWRAFSGRVSTVAAVAAAPATVLNAYLAALTVAGYLRRPLASPERAERTQAGHRFVVLVPAHNEEGTIGSTIDSVVQQQYPADLFTVHVVADNCTDATADIARRHGACVHERFDTDAPGKGPALGWLLDRVTADGQSPDAAVIIDADTSLQPEYLCRMDSALHGPGSAWQTYYTVRDPDLSTNTALRHAALALRHYVRPLGRTALGGSSGLFGNGMVFRTDLLRRHRFSAHLTEDIEFQLELLLEGELVDFVPDAVVMAEMPTTLSAARTQNERWELGRVQLARRFVPELARQAVKPGIRHRAAFIDATLDQLVPPLSVLTVGTVVVAAAAIACGRGSPARRSGAVLSCISMGALMFHVIGGLRLAGVPRATYRALLHTPRLVLWKVRLWARVLIRPEGVAWTRTQRNDP
jgi:cellulose synthase/poly-beta-1,6-N-acetylglucosamine synthase-like glycosyltransferase